ncbi:cyclin-dependent kinase 14 isoform X2 [Chrysoperla carnea]|uniref:cyclin-dependent kinase 14 isoform X2 n=1 Tax=Chrysoperla carnea TaxID=189513 RepID=UPI001D09647C|nr:cyclin-dependent kinase 14 isoform X2 [Chrysoperla carnea]
MYCNIDKSHTSGAPPAAPTTKTVKEGVTATPGLPVVTMREKKSGALSRVQKLKKRLSHSFGRLSISKEEVEDPPRGKLPYNGYSDEFLDRLEPNGNIPSGKGDLRYDFSTHDRVQRQLSVSSDSKLLDEDIREEARVILRPPKPPRPKSEVLLHQPDSHNRRTKRFSAFGGDSPFGKSEAYIKLEQLGEGSYATVFKGYSNLTNQVVALKEIRLQEEEGAPFTAIREASLLKELKHTNIVTLHDIVHTRETLTFVFEYVHTDLSQYMERHPGGLVCNNVRLFLFQLLRGLAYCHKRRVLHRDVKPQNLLISEIGELKLADFGLARAKSVPSHTYSHEVVTLWYRPPDVLLGSTEYSTSLDMWGVGCIFVEMLTGVPTFPGVRDIYDQLVKIFKMLGTPGEEEWPGVTRLPGYKPERLGWYRSRPLGVCWPRLHDTPLGESMAEALLQLDPDKRIDAASALQHPYFSKLPRKVHTLPDDTSIFSVEGIYLHPENRNNRGILFEHK